MGALLRQTGRFAEALKYLQRFHERGSKDPSSRDLSARWMQQCEELVKFDQQVPGVLKGDIQPASLQEWLGYFQVCRLKNAYKTALQLWNQLFLKHSALV